MNCETRHSWDPVENAPPLGDGMEWFYSVCIGKTKQVLMAIFPQSPIDMAGVVDGGGNRQEIASPVARITSEGVV